MKLFDQLSIKNKLMGIILSITIVALLCGFTFVIVDGVATFKAEMVEKIKLGAQITSDFLVTDLTFGDKVDAANTLARLLALADVTYAVVYDADNHLVSEVGSRGLESDLPLPQTVNHLFDGNLLCLFHPINFQGTAYGLLCIQASTERLDTKINKYIATMFFILLGIVAVAAFVAFKLQGLISRPILALAATASAISKNADYTIRVNRRSNDEIGVLYDGFNNMLDEIAQREKALRKSEAQYRTLFEQATDAIFISDSEGKSMSAQALAKWWDTAKMSYLDGHLTSSSREKT